MAVKEVSWKPGTRFSVKPTVALRELEKIKKKNSGELTAEVVVEVAAAEKHPLHKEFEWDNSIAGEKFRRTQAATMLRALVVTYEEAPETPVRQYSITTSTRKAESDRPKRVFKSTDDILKDPEMRAELLAQAFADLRAFQARFRGLQELAPVFRGISEMLEAQEA